MHDYPAPPPRSDKTNGWHQWVEQSMREIWSRTDNTDLIASIDHLDDQLERRKDEIDVRLRDIEGIVNRGIGIMVGVSALSSIVVGLILKFL